MTTSAVIAPAPAGKARNARRRTTILKLDSPELKALLDELAAGASEREAKRIAPHEQIRQIAAAGLGRLRIPVAEGGAGVSLRELFRFLIQLGEADSNLVHILRVHYWFVEAQLQRATTRSAARAQPGAHQPGAHLRQRLLGAEPARRRGCTSTRRSRPTRRARATV